MKSTITFILALMLPLVTLSALEIMTTDGKFYRQCEIVKVEPDALKIIHADGGARIPYEKLPASLQKQFFDPEKVAAFRQQKEQTLSKDPLAPEIKASAGYSVIPVSDLHGTDITFESREALDSEEARKMHLLAFSDREIEQKLKEGPPSGGFLIIRYWFSNIVIMDLDGKVLSRNADHLDSALLATLPAFDRGLLLRAIDQAGEKIIEFKIMRTPVK